MQTGEEYCKNLPEPVGFRKPLARLTVYLSASGPRDFEPALKKHTYLCAECPLHVNDEVVHPVRLK